MNCNDIRENLIELLAEGPGSTEVRAHVAQCSACAQELDSLKKTMALLDEWEAPEPSPYFMTRLRAHAREERQQAQSFWRTWLRRPALAVSLGLLLVIGGISYKMLQPPIELPSDTTDAVSDLESLDKNHDLLVNSDLVDDVAGLNQNQQQDSSE